VLRKGRQLLLHLCNALLKINVSAVCTLVTGKYRNYLQYDIWPTS
jgi:hypothetical protein